MELITVNDIDHDFFMNISIDLIALCEFHQWHICHDHRRIMITPFQCDTDDAFSILTDELPRLVDCDIGFETKN